MQFNADYDLITDEKTHWASPSWTVNILCSPSEKPALDAYHAALDQKHPDIKAQLQKSRPHHCTTANEYGLSLHHCNEEVYALMKQHLSAAPT